MTEERQAPASRRRQGSTTFEPETENDSPCVASVDRSATLPFAEGWTTPDGRSLKTGFIGLVKEVLAVKEPTFVQETSPPSGGLGQPASIAVVRHETPSSVSRNVQGWGTAFGEGRVVGSSVNREAPSKRKLGGGVVTPFSHPKFSKNQDLCGDHPPCVVCGKPVKSPDAPSVRVLDGGTRFATEAEAAKDVIDSGDMGSFPVGPDCARKLRKAGVYMTRPT
jgi:hypothetical protein